MFTEEEKRQLIAAGRNPDEWEYVPERKSTATAEAAPQSSALGAFGRAGARGLIPSLGAAIGGTLPAYLLGPEVGLPATIAATLIGGGLGSIGAEKAQQAAIDKFAPSWNTQAALDAQQHPVASTVGGVASALPFFELNPMGAAKGLGAAYKLGRGLVPEAEQAAARAAAYGTGAQLGLGAATGVVNPLLEGRAPTWQDVGMGAGQAALLGRHRGYLGEIPGLGFMRHPTEGALQPSMTVRPGEQYPQAIGPEYVAPFRSMYPEGMSMRDALSAGGQNALIARAQERGPLPEPAKPAIGLGQGETEVSPTYNPARLVGTLSEERVGPQPVEFHDPVIDHLQRQLDSVREVADDTRITISKRVEAQMAIDEIQKKLDVARLAARAGSAPVDIRYEGYYPPAKAPKEKTIYVGAGGEAKVGDYPRVFAVGGPESYGRRAAHAEPVVIGQEPANRGPLVPVSVPHGTIKEPIGAGYAGTYPPTAMQLGTFERRQGPPPQRSPMPVEPGLKYNVVPPEQLQAEFPLRKSSAAPENIPATQAYAATHPVPAPVRDLPEHPGTEKWTALPEKPAEVRQGQGEQNLSSGSLRPGQEVTQEPGAIKKLAASVQLSGSQEPVVSATAEGHAGVNDRLNAILARQGADPNIKFQEAVRTAEELPAQDLLSHPVNADILAASNKVAERLNITAQRDDAEVRTPKGTLAAGWADLRSRMIKWNGKLATLDTAFHELGHVFFDDLRTSPDPAARALYDEGMRIFGGDEERLMNSLGLRNVDYARARIEGNLMVKFKAWAKEFWHWVKGNFSDEAHIVNLLARRMVDGEMVARGERPALQGPTLRFQEARQKEEARTTETTKTLQSHDWSIPFLRPVMENVRRIPGLGPHLFNAFSSMRDVKNDVLGRYKNQVNLILERTDPWYSLKKPNATAIAERMFKEQEDRNYTGPLLNPKADAAYSQIRDLLIKAADEANQRGIKVMDGDIFREIIKDRRYIPHMLSGPAAFIMRQKPGSVEFNKLRTDYMDWLMKGGLKGEGSKMTAPDAQAAWEARVRGLSSPTSNEDAGSSSFGPLEKARGYGLPESMREKSLSTILNRYFSRYAQKTAWYEGVEKDTPENAVTRTMLDATDQFGSKKKNATQLDDGTRIELLNGHDDVAAAVRDLRQNYDRSDLVVDAFDRLFKSGMMQTLTGFADFTGGIANSAQHLKLSDYVTLTPRAVSRIADGIRAGLAQNVIQLHAARLQYGSEGTTGESQMMGRRIDNLVKVTNAISDGIYRITGRDAFEKWSRGLLMSMGMVKTEDVIGRIRSGKHEASDIKWMDTFMERGKWEGLLKDGADNISTELQERIAAKFVQSVQGSYDVFGLPAWAMSGKLAPFFALGRWNLEKANNFTKYVINPMRQGDFAPFLKMTLGAAVAGEAVHLFRQMVTARKPQDADWKEIMTAGGQGLDYRLLASMAYSGYSGALADILKQAYDIGHGNQAQGFRFPVVSAITGFANRGSQFAQALEEGENPLALLPQLALTVAKDNIQMARALTRYASEDEQQDVERANALRDLKVFRQQAGIPVPPAIGQQANPFLNPLKKNFQRATDLSTAGQLAPQLFQQALSRSQGDPERLRSLLRNYAAPSSDVMPSAIRTPLQFSQYVKWLEATQGGPAAQAAQQQYFQKSLTDNVKRSLVPQL